MQSGKLVDIFSTFFFFFFFLTWEISKIFENAIISNILQRRGRQICFKISSNFSRSLLLNRFFRTRVIKRSGADTTILGERISPAEFVMLLFSTLITLSVILKFSFQILCARLDGEWLFCYVKSGGKKY